MLRALGVVVLTCCLPLFLVALQAQDAQSAPMQGQGADVAKGRPLPAPEPDSMLIPSWYLKEMEPKAVQKETFQMGGSDRVPVSGEEGEAIQGTRAPAQLQRCPRGSATLEKAKTADYQGLSKNYILGTVAASAVLLLTIMVCAIVMSRLRRRDTDKSKAESGEGAGRGERDQANTKFNNSCRLSPGIFAAELAQLYRNMGTDPTPLPACPSCSLADRASSRENWVSLDSLQPTLSWCPCYQYQQGYFTSDDDDSLMDNK
ncbi:PREDICTED: uncharacterized protein LOC108501615 isoform X2 [Lepidothrix coronata]|uniref:Uncharacterized protein LOC108501615 isoform X2 n=1 Tax=Lepidothrix coronata TaxID=321398 RepID=A0A6J0I042_9PASS|nr:PREDICTED: uncharacterized protein LOC108501615 isoform X2 [Lepidothrix coronata]